MRNRAAYQGELSCPVCYGKAIRFIEDLGPLRKRYRCRKCGLPFQYDISNRRDIHPYAALRKPRFDRLVEQWNRINRRKTQ